MSDEFADWTSPPLSEEEKERLAEAGVVSLHRMTVLGENKFASAPPPKQEPKGDEFAQRMREFGDNVGLPNRAARRAIGLTKSRARRLGWLPKFAAPKQTQIKKPKKGRPSG